jgi:hypothetical protein
MFNNLILYTKTFVTGFFEGLKILFTTRTSLREILVNTIIFGILTPFVLLVHIVKWLFRDIVSDVKRGIKWKS